MKRRAVRIEVSDHAVLRWLEREHGLDVAPIRASIAGLVMNAAELQALAVCVGKVRFVLRDTIAGRPGDVTVVTVLERGMLIGEESLR